MRSYFFAALLVLLLAAVLTQEPFVFTLLYLLLAVFAVDLLWKRQVPKSIKCQRIMQSHAFPDEEVQVRLQVKNNGVFPLIWGRLNEGLPAGISLRLFHHVISVGGKQKEEKTYRFKATKRGVYTVGPLTLTHGDLMGFTRDMVHQWDAQPLVVYPRVYPLGEMGFPSTSPLGHKKHHQPIFEDPTRPIGKRDYQPGDSIRRIDWKSSAVVNELQVKQYEPAIALETMIFLDLNLAVYKQKRYFDVVELAISAAASIANYVIETREKVGLVSNGTDSLSENQLSNHINPDKGYSQLMQILTTLARIQPQNKTTIEQLIQSQFVNLSWGSTLILISGGISETLLPVLIQAQRVGLKIVLILVGEQEDLPYLKSKANVLGFQFHHIQYSVDLRTLEN